ncbi:hypothetical protein ABID22_000624 [Pontibacter aydingkolensis]|uniref:Secreted protein n=1 Tax=Pontibacter aydingkolensis TaxID=1911536 RepID=A0ABS7CRT2_9BACT|nr:hypothetical protein [Pontibacter aydingkolensis]MBW7466500.1 hypothetical protein [Pontibacter aydingkolensis]
MILLIYTLTPLFLLTLCNPQSYLPILSPLALVPSGREASSSGIALLSLPLLLRRNASLKLVNGTSRGAQPMDWDGHFLASGYCNLKQSINSDS